jgi:glyoxylate/hydroxypyruvate reductase A
MSLLLATDFAPDTLAAWAEQLRVALPGVPVLTERKPATDGEITMALIANPPAGALKDLPRLGFIQSMWAGVDKLLRDDSLPSHVPLARMVDPAMSAAMAETALWATLSLHRDYFGYAEQQRAGQWQQLPQRRAGDVHVAVLGLGEMGRAVALRLAGNGYFVSGWSRRQRVMVGVDTCHGDHALADLLRVADVVINLLPLTVRTHSLFDERRFSQMKRGAGFVNLARGQHVVEAALLAALDNGRIGRAVLDVFHTEPLPPNHRFWVHPQVTLLPHAAALTDLTSATGIAVANLKAFLEGRPISHLVDRTKGY